MSDSETQYCQHYSISSGTYYSSCNGYCCGEATSQDCCYDSYDTDQTPALGLGVAFGVVFAIVVLIVLVFLCRVICCPKKERAVEPEHHKQNRVKHYKHEESDIIYLKPVIRDSTYLKPVVSDSTYLKPVVSDSTYRKLVVSDSAYLKPVVRDSTYLKPSTIYYVENQSEPLYTSVTKKINSDEPISYVVYTEKRHK